MRAERQGLGHPPVLPGSVLVSAGHAGAARPVVGRGGQGEPLL